MIKIEVPEYGIFVSAGKVRGVEVRRSGEEVQRVLKDVLDEMSYDLKTLKDNPIIRAFRNFYWKIGIDPTKQRPSSEALVRRALRGKFPLINNVVDAGNIASLETLIPIGLYDLDEIRGELEMRIARRDVFHPIGGGEEILEGQIVLADEEKVLHVYPYRDSRETMIKQETKNVLVVSCGVPRVGRKLVLDACKKAASYILMFAGGEGGDCTLTP